MRANKPELDSNAVLAESERPEIRRMSSIPFAGFSLTRGGEVVQDAKHKAVIRVLLPISGSF